MGSPGRRSTLWTLLGFEPSPSLSLSPSSPEAFKLPSGTAGRKSSFSHIYPIFPSPPKSLRRLDLQNQSTLVLYVSCCFHRLTLFSALLREFQFYCSLMIPVVCIVTDTRESMNAYLLLQPKVVFLGLPEWKIMREALFWQSPFGALWCIRFWLASRSRTFFQFSLACSYKAKLSPQDSIWTKNCIQNANINSVPSIKIFLFQLMDFWHQPLRSSKDTLSLGICFFTAA